jgi:hypothetical protein
VELQTPVPIAIGAAFLAEIYGWHTLQPPRCPRSLSGGELTGEVSQLAGGPSLADGRAAANGAEAAPFDSAQLPDWPPPCAVHNVQMACHPNVPAVARGTSSWIKTCRAALEASCPLRLMRSRRRRSEAFISSLEMVPNRAEIASFARRRATTPRDPGRVRASQARGSGIRRPGISLRLLAARTTMIRDDDCTSGKLTTRRTGPPSRWIGLRKYSGKLNLFRIETGISRKNALSRDARNC